LYLTNGASKPPQRYQVGIHYNNAKWLRDLQSMIGVT
jgi:hypothetical protein